MIDKLREAKQSSTSKKVISNEIAPSLRLARILNHKDMGRDRKLRALIPLSRSMDLEIQNLVEKKNEIYSQIHHESYQSIQPFKTSFNRNRVSLDRLSGKSVNSN